MNRANWAVDFAGDNDYITITEYAGIDITSGGITIEFWVKPDVTNAFQGFVTKSNVADNQIQYNVYVYNDSKIRFYFYTGSATHTWTSTNDLLTAGTWSHVAISYTFGTGSSLKCYVDGVDKAGAWSGTGGTGNATPANNNEPVKIGAYSTSQGYLNGKMCDVRIWNTARTQSDIIHTMNKRLLGNETNLVAYFPLDEGTGTTATNLVSGGNNGTLTNVSGTYWVDGAPISGSGSILIN